MESMQSKAIILVPADEWNFVVRTLQEILSLLNRVAPVEQSGQKVISPYITAKEFMSAVRICRSNFDKLVHRGKIMTLKKGRKVYVVASEVDRYFREVQV